MRSLSTAQKKFIHLVRSRWAFSLFTLQRLPLAWITGLRVTSLQASQAAVSVRYRYWNKNPFRSIYFAVLAMAAELSTGLLAFMYVYQRQPKVSMLVTYMESHFTKKAVGKVTFTCHQGEAIAAAIEQAVATGEGQEVKCLSTGVNAAGEEVARFVVQWSFKVKS